MDDGEFKTTITGAFQSPTFGKDGSFTVNEAVGSASISPCGRDVVLASRQGLHIIDLDNPYSPPRYLPHHTPWEVADVQWSPFASRDAWVVSTSNQKALVWNLEASSPHAQIQHVLHAHSRAITDINFSAHHPDYLATCAVDSFVHCWDLRDDRRPAISFADWFAGASQVKWNRQEPHIIASSHDKHLHIWDDRKGAYPLRSIEAHSTKIYGIDWNRVSSTSLLTCSLDKTIKIWDYEKEDNIPQKVIRTDYPIWRARHTPFGHGVLAMPQRGNYDLHLYSIGEEESTEGTGITKPCHSFPGHQNSVKEFLWRTRGGIQEGHDMREFQLVTWSNDKTLLLHRLDDEVVQEVGFTRGAKVDPRINFTRNNARYKTFKDEAKSGNDSDPSMMPVLHGLSSLLRGRQGSNTPNRASSGPTWRYSERSGGRSIMQVRQADKKGQNPITWMKGVKIAKADTEPSSGRDSAQRLTSSGAPPWDTPESLGDEITHVGDKYKNVSFEDVDVPNRAVTVAFNGPWGIDKSLVHTRVSIKFPGDYPELSAPSFLVEKRSSISDATQSKLALGLRTIASGYVGLGRGSLEAILGYLLGEQDLEQSTSWITHEQEFMNASSVQRVDESSSDEEDVAIGDFSAQPQTELDASGHDISKAANMNATIPLPKACGALWAENGQLVCFFPQKEPTQEVTSSIQIDSNDKTMRTHDTFEGFGRLPVFSSGNRTTTGTSGNGHSRGSESSDNSSSSSSSVSSSSSDSEDAFPSRYQLHPAWRNHFINPHNRSMDQSLKSSAPTVMRHKTGNPKTNISVHILDDILPAQKCLAAEYIIFGDGPEVCKHNSEVATRHGFSDLADIWALLQLILCNEVPLEVMPQTHRKEDILVLARRSLVQIKRRDSGLDLAFDEPESITSSKIKGRVKWGQHPLGAWLVGLMFEHFEQLADVQMLAMMSCVLSEPSPSPSHVDNETQGKSPFRYAMPLDNLPGFSFSYYPTADVAWSMFQPSASGTPSIKEHARAIEAYGSYGSSEGVWGSDADPEQAILQSTGTTPPQMMRQHSRTSNGSQNQLENSPEHSIKRSNSTISNPFSVSLRPFSFMASASPPSRKLSKGQPELSTSAPSSGAITWGRNIIYNDISSPSMLRNRSSASYAPDDTDTDDEVSGAEDFDVSISLKNQNMFDDEGCVNVPLLDSEHSIRYRCYRESYANLLFSWSMPFAACELLKFNGIATTALNPETPNFWLEHPLSNTRTSSQPFVAVALHCSSCGNVVLPSQQPEPEQRKKALTQQASPSASPLRCGKCHVVARKPTCTICYTSISGLYKACLRCGHCSHTSCLQHWLAVCCDVDTVKLSQVDPHRDVPCEAGCGCICSDIDTLISSAEPPVDSVVQDNSLSKHLTGSTTTSPVPMVEHGSPALGHEDGSGWDEIKLSPNGLAHVGRKVSNVGAAAGDGGPDTQDVFSWSRAASLLQKYSSLSEESSRQQRHSNGDP